MKTLPHRKEAQRKELIFSLYKKIDMISANPSSNALDEHKQIEDLLNKIIQIEKDITLKLPRREDKWTKFQDWCRQNGIDMDQIEIKQVANEEFGLFSKSNFAPNDVLLRIPRKLFLTNETALSDPQLGGFFQDILFTHMPNLILALYLIAEYSKQDSFWKSYLQTLPGRYSTVLYMSHAELTQLQGSPLFEEVLKIKLNVARQYAYLWMKLHKQSKQFSLLSSSFTFDLYRWALSTVMTRQNSVPCQADSSKRTLALIPLWDLCNHRHAEFCTDFDTKLDCLVFYSTSNINPGDEIFNHYGDRSNADFFLHNGFVYDQHPNDSVRIKLGLSSSDPLFALKETLCKKINLPPQGVYELEHKCRQLNPKLLAFVRIFLLEKDQLEKWIETNNAEELLDEGSTQLATLNEKVSQFLALRCMLLNKKYLPVDKYLNTNIEKIVTCEKRILVSHFS